MYVLGLNIGDKLETEDNSVGHIGHDSAAVLLQNGRVVAGIEEERLSRVKHCNFFPERAINFCLDLANIQLSEIDYIAVNLSEYDGVIRNTLAISRDASKAYKSGKEALSEYFEILFDYSVVDKLVFCPHHDAHVWSAFIPSQFIESLVVILDGYGPSGDGRGLSGIIGVAHDKNYETILEIPSNQSIGNFYSNIIRIIGYNRFDEYKVMGLAPYGDPNVFRELFKSLYQLKENGEVDIVNNPIFQIRKHTELASSLMPPRRKNGLIKQVHKDFAAAIQEALESMVLHILEHYQKNTGQRNLCLAGGVAHNCTMNKAIIESGLFEQIYVQPAAHDAGGALGAACFAHCQKTNTSPNISDHLYWGTPLPSAAAVYEHIASWGSLLKCEKLHNTTSQVAKILAGGAIIAWVQGRSEFAPRALGNRSILADPRPFDNRARINKVIKKREGYRPFAPSVTVEDTSKYFSINVEPRFLQYMNIIVDVVPKYQSQLGAITHCDGTARVQTVSKETNCKYWQLIKSFEAATGLPILLNTSFNSNAEPIVDSIEDAILSFLTMDLDYLVIDDYLITQNECFSMHAPIYSFSLKPSYSLVSEKIQISHGQEHKYCLKSKTSRLFQQREQVITKHLFDILLLDGKYSLAECCERLEIELSANLINEILTALEKRIIAIKPSL